MQCRVRKFRQQKEHSQIVRNWLLLLDRSGWQGTSECSVIGWEHSKQSRTSVVTGTGWHPELATCPPQHVLLKDISLSIAVATTQKLPVLLIPFLAMFTRWRWHQARFLHYRHGSCWIESYYAQLFWCSNCPRFGQQESLFKSRPTILQTVLTFSTE